MPKEPLEQERFKRRLIATARSLRKKQLQLQASQDFLNDRWTEVLAAEEYGLSSPNKSHPDSRWLPQYDGRAMEPIPPSNNAAGQSQFGLDKEAAEAEHHTKPSGTEGRAGRRRSMYRSRRDTPPDDYGRLSGHYKAATPGPSTVNGARRRYIIVWPNIEEPHTPSASQMK